MTTALLLQILIPAALSFLAGHFHFILPNPLKNGGGSVPFPSSIGHGEIIAWLLTRLASQQSTPVIPVAPVGPAVPAAPSSTAADILTELLSVLRQVLAQSAPAPQPPKAA
jgi:hypothetical protein